jgi:hypothetical protein
VRRWGVEWVEDASSRGETSSLPPFHLSSLPPRFRPAGPLARGPDGGPTMRGYLSALTQYFDGSLRSRLVGRGVARLPAEIRGKDRPRQDECRTRRACRGLVGAFFLGAAQWAPAPSPGAFVVTRGGSCFVNVTRRESRGGCAIVEAKGASCIAG